MDFRVAGSICGVEGDAVPTGGRSSAERDANLWAVPSCFARVALAVRFLFPLDGTALHRVQNGRQAGFIVGVLPFRADGSRPVEHGSTLTTISEGVEQNFLNQQAG